jgi:hypothetical protein
MTPAELAKVREKLPVSGAVARRSLDQLKENHERATDLRSTAGDARDAGVQRGHTRASAFVERDLGNGAVGAVQVQERLGERFLVRVTSHRRRLLDEDNLCVKYHVDLCRYAGALPSDAPGTATIEIHQEKVGPKEAERVDIQIYRL